MGAQSVTGVGVGSAEGLAKGPKERNFVGVEKLIGPRVVAAGKLVLTGGATSGTVNFRNPLPCVTPVSAAATPPTPQADYVVLLLDETTRTAQPSVAFTNSDAAGVTHSSNLDVCLKGVTIANVTANDTVAWTVIKVGD
jgi:hypothetical protein